MTTYTAN